MQAVMNTTARLIFGIGKYDSIQHVFLDRLHCLPVSKRIQSNLSLLALNAFNASRNQLASRHLI